MRRHAEVRMKPPWRALAAGAWTVACAALAACAPASPPAPAAGELLYVASQEDAQVWVIDMTTRRVVDTVDLTEMGFSRDAQPHDVAVEPDGSAWYVSLISAGKVLKLDRRNRLVAQADFQTPGMLSLDPAGDLLYVGRSMAAVNPPRRVGVIRRGTMNLDEVDVFVPRPHALVVDAVGRRFFTASMGESRAAWAPLDTEEVELIDLPGEHQMIVQFAISPDGAWMVGGGQMSGDLLVFDLRGAEPRVVRSVEVGGQPWHPSFTPDGAEVWVPNLAANTVTVVDARAWTVVGVVSHPALAEPHGSAVSADGRTVWISGQNRQGGYRPSAGGAGRPGTVVAIDRARREVVAVLEIGRYASGMATAVPMPSP